MKDAKDERGHKIQCEKYTIDYLFRDEDVIAGVSLSCFSANI